MNLRKLNYGLVALVLGFGLVVTQSAFKPSNNLKTTKYGYDIHNPSNPWVDLTGKSIENGDYRCNEPLVETCVAEFATPPDEETPRNTNMVSEGEFELL
ncbi:MAG: hypothetical protein EOP54_17255 [Sphingobacteriales bacterium]|nr:MAG: hypothetical protein EOP54_17255 [Sphingobacteriales bacterium]